MKWSSVLAVNHRRPDEFDPKNVGISIGESCIYIDVPAVFHPVNGGSAV
jgi:hypothetical protein